VADILLDKALNTKVVAYVSSVGDICLPKDIQKNFYENPPTRQDVDRNGSFSLYSRKVKYSETEITLKYESILVDDSENNIYDNNGNIISQRKGMSSETYENLIESYDFQEKFITRCPHRDTALKILMLILLIKSEKDSIGGTITGVCTNVPPALGEPCFDKLEALLAHAMLSLPATKGFEIGSGFEGTRLRGSQHNDAFIFPKTNDITEEIKSDELSMLKTKTNNAGGTLGGISTGANIYFKVAFKPVSTIGLPQDTCDYQGNTTTLEAKGRHDPCVLPRAPAIVEAMASITLADLYLQQKSRQL
jgi:chorismate synthase